MTKGKRILTAGLAAPALVVACRLFLPCPIRGNWSGGRGFFAICGCDAHRFLRFRDGSATSYDEHANRCLRIQYHRIGWNAYRYDQHDITWSDDGLVYTVETNTFWTVRPGWFFMQIDTGDESYRIHRDLRVLRARKIIADKTTFESFTEMLDRIVEMRKRKQSESAQQGESTVPSEAAPIAPSDVR